MHQEGTAELLQSNLGFNIVRTQGKYVGCRQSLGPIDFGTALKSLSKRYSAEDFVVEDTREGVLIRVCELEKLRLERIIGKRQLRRMI